MPLSGKETVWSMWYKTTQKGSGFKIRQTNALEKMRVEVVPTPMSDKNCQPMFWEY